MVVVGHTVTSGLSMSDPEDQAIDVTIEALTGTIYDLCVSPYETILGIKMKIQRLEGELATSLVSWAGL